MLNNLKKFVKGGLSRIRRKHSPRFNYKFYKTPYKLQKLGTEYGGWIIPVDIVHKDSICYLAGAGEDISFDISLAKKFHCNIFIFDPTPRAKAHFEQVLEAAESGVSEYTHAKTKYDLSRGIRSYMHFDELGIWKKHDLLRFFVPKDSSHISHSITNLQNTDNYIEVSVERLNDIMKMKGHSHLDILKLDIEGAEFDVIDSIIEDRINIHILCVEFHNQGKNGLDQIQSSINKLAANNYAVIARENLDLTFINKSFGHLASK